MTDSDSGRLPEGEDAPAAECEASQSGAVGNRPTTPSIQGETSELVKRLRQHAAMVGRLSTKDARLAIEAADTIERLQALSPDSRNVLSKCAERFREYEASHRAKPLASYKSDPDADAAIVEAERNREMAELCEAALANEARAYRGDE